MSMGRAIGLGYNQLDLARDETFKKGSFKILHLLQYRPRLRHVQ